MIWNEENTSSFFYEDYDCNNENNSLACYESSIAIEEIYKSTAYGHKEKLTTNYSPKKDEQKTDITIEPVPITLGMLVKEYETWEGRVVEINVDDIKARITNTQRIYSPRILQIKKAFILSKGISKPLNVGDMFELTFKHINTEFETKKKVISQKEQVIDTIRLIEQVYMTRQEIDTLVSEELKALSFLFE